MGDLVELDIYNRAATASYRSMECYWSLCCFGHCLVINRESICHYGETLLCLKLPQRFSCETWQNKDDDNDEITSVYLRLYMILHCYKSLSSHHDMAEHRSAKDCMMHSDLQALLSFYPKWLTVTSCVHQYNAYIPGVGIRASCSRMPTGRLQKLGIEPLCRESNTVTTRGYPAPYYIELTCRSSGVRAPWLPHLRTHCRWSWDTANQCHKNRVRLCPKEITSATQC